MKRSKPCLPRKMKKAVLMLEIDTDKGIVRPTFRARYRRYPRTRWVVRAERQFYRLFSEYQQKVQRLRELESLSETLKKQ